MVLSLVVLLCLLYLRSSCLLFFFFLMIRRPPRSTLDRSSAASDVYKRQVLINTRFSNLSRLNSTLKNHFYIVLTQTVGVLMCSICICMKMVSVRTKAASILVRIDDVCLLYTSPSPRDRTRSRMPSSA